MIALNKPARDPMIRGAVEAAGRITIGPVTANSPAFRPLTGIFEPSAIQQLPDGRFLVVEDEKSTR